MEYWELGVSARVLEMRRRKVSFSSAVIVAGGSGKNVLRMGLCFDL